MARAITSRIHETGKADQLLGRLPVELRQKVLVKALKKGANIVAKEARRLAPVGTKEKPIRLRETIRTVTKHYGQRVVTFTGPTYGKGLGNHGHLVEFGHRKVLWGKATGQRVRPIPFMRPSADTTVGQQQSAIIGELQTHARTLRGT